MTTARIENPFPNVPQPAGTCTVDPWLDTETRAPF